MKYKHFIYTLFIGLIFAGCSGDNVDNPTFDDDELPKIYMEWASTFVYKLNDVVKHTAVVSPNDNISCRWLINNEVVSNSLSVEYKITSSEPFTLRFEVERNGLSSYRTAQITVAKSSD